MIHFFEALERKIDYQFEYQKLETMMIFEEVWSKSLGYRITLEDFIEKYFRSWKHRGSYTTFMELRNQLGFGYDAHYGVSGLANYINMEDYFLYCEMLLNIGNDLHRLFDANINNQYLAIESTMRATIEKSGFEIREVDGIRIVAEKNAAAIEVAGIVPDLADVIVEYNHYLLKGNIERKHEILKKIADAMEPQREELEGLDPRSTNDFFYMVNNMNVRHNNCDPRDKAHYNESFANLTSSEKEDWYDKIYELSLYLFMLPKLKQIKDDVKSAKK